MSGPKVGPAPLRSGIRTLVYPLGHGWGCRVNHRRKEPPSRVNEAGGEAELLPETISYSNEVCKPAGPLRSSRIVQLEALASLLEAIDRGLGGRQ